MMQEALDMGDEAHNRNNALASMVSAEKKMFSIVISDLILFCDMNSFLSNWFLA